MYILHHSVQRRLRYIDDTYLIARLIYSLFFLQVILLKYGILTQAQIDEYSSEKWEEVSNHEARTRRLRHFNAALERECLAHEIEYASVMDIICDELGNVRDEYRDVSEYNIHILWEPLIVQWCKYFNNYGITEKNLTDIKYSGCPSYSRTVLA